MNIFRKRSIKWEGKILLNKIFYSLNVRFKILFLNLTLLDKRKINTSHGTGFITMLQIGLFELPPFATVDNHIIIVGIVKDTYDTGKDKWFLIGVVLEFSLWLFT